MKYAFYKIVRTLDESKGFFSKSDKISTGRFEKSRESTERFSPPKRKHPRERHACFVVAGMEMARLFIFKGCTLLTKVFVRETTIRRRV